MPAVPMNAKQFERTIRNWGNRNMPRIGRAIQASVTQHIYEGIVQKTPVLTSLARGNWIPSVSSPSDITQAPVAGVTITGAPLTAGEKFRGGAIKKQLEALPLGQVNSYITNNLPYIQGLEDGTISNKAAPGAMVQQTIINSLDGLQVSIMLKGVEFE